MRSISRESRVMVIGQTSMEKPGFTPETNKVLLPAVHAACSRASTSGRAARGWISDSGALDVTLQPERRISSRSSMTAPNWSSVAPRAA